MTPERQEELEECSRRMQTASNPDHAYMTTMYAELCKSYHAIDEFRMKLLGLLPLASVVSLFAIDKSGIKSAGEVAANEIVAYVGLFAAMFTIALFVYEIRGILMCHDLMTSGRALETLMNVTGQFNVGGEQRHLPCYDCKWKRRVAQQFNAKLAAYAIYSLVFAAWLFVALRYGFGVQNVHCL